MTQTHTHGLIGVPAAPSGNGAYRQPRHVAPCPTTASVPTADAATTDRRNNERLLWITVVSEQEALMTLVPGDLANGQLGVGTYASPAAHLEAGYVFIGCRSSAVQFTTAVFTTLWQHRWCPASEVPAKGIPRYGMYGYRSLGRFLAFGAEGQPWIRARIRLPDDPVVPEGAAARLRLTADGSGGGFMVGPAHPTPKSGPAHSNSSRDTSEAAAGSTIPDLLAPAGTEMAGTLLRNFMLLTGGLAISLLTRIPQRSTGRA